MILFIFKLTLSLHKKLHYCKTSAAFQLPHCFNIFLSHYLLIVNQVCFVINRYKQKSQTLMLFSFFKEENKSLFLFNTRRLYLFGRGKTSTQFIVHILPCFLLILISMFTRICPQKCHLIIQSNTNCNSAVFYFNIF